MDLYPARMRSVSEVQKEDIGFRNVSDDSALLQSAKEIVPKHFLCSAFLEVGQENRGKALFLFSSTDPDPDPDPLNQIAKLREQPADQHSGVDMGGVCVKPAQETMTKLRTNTSARLARLCRAQVAFTLNASSQRTRAPLRHLCARRRT